MFDHVDPPRRMSRLSGLKEGLIRVKMRFQIIIGVVVLSTDVGKVDASSGF